MPRLRTPPRSGTSRLRFLLEALDKNDQPMRAALNPQRVCAFAHLRQALNAARSQQAFDTLVSITATQLSALIDDLDEFIRKNDHRFREEKIRGEEKESWRASLTAHIG